LSGLSQPIGTIDVKGNNYTAFVIISEQVYQNLHIVKLELTS